MSIATAPAFQIRDYQQKCVTEVMSALRKDGRTLVVSPTGTGKTVMLWSIIKRFLAERNERVLIIAHREELINQAAAKGLHFGIDCEIEMAQQRADGGLLGSSPVVVGSVQSLNAGRRCGPCQTTLSHALMEWEEGGKDRSTFPGMPLGCPSCLEGTVRRLQRFQPSAFGLIVVDEAHHSTATSYQRILDYFDTPTTKVVGVTATPDRHDEESLGQIYRSVAFEYELPDAIADGWLVPIEQHFVEVEDLDLSQCGKNKYGDMQDKDVAAAMQRLRDEGELHKMVDPTVQLAGDRRTLVFAASVAHAEAMTDIFNRHKQGSAEFLSGETPKERRKETLRRFAAGDFQYLCNCALFLEGFDDPGIECVAVGRPTASRALYSQIVGRGTRPLPGIVDGLSEPTARRSAIELSQKPSVLVLDYVGNSGRHKLISTVDILGGRESERVVQLAYDLARNNKSSDPVDMAMAIEEAKRAIQKRQEEEEELRRQRMERDERKSGRKANGKPVVRTRFSTKAINPFDVFDIMPRREAGWHRGRKPTEKQRAALAKFGVDDQAIKKASFTEASQMLDSLFKRREAGKCTLKQARLLKKHGFSIDCTMQEASATIDQIAKSNWKLRGPE